MIRTTAAAAVLLGVALLLPACTTVERLGVVGVTRTADGALAAAVARCGAPLARVEVIHGPAGHRATDLTLDAFRPARDPVVVVPLAREVPDWHRTPQEFEPSPVQEYVLVGTDRARRATTGEVAFTTGALPDLGPDAVLVARASGRTEVVPLAEFRRLGAAACG